MTCFKSPRTMRFVILFFLSISIPRRSASHSTSLLVLFPIPKVYGITLHPQGSKIIPLAPTSLGFPFEEPSKKRIVIFWFSLHWLNPSLLFQISQGWISRGDLVWKEFWLSMFWHQLNYSGRRSSEWGKETCLEEIFSCIMFMDLKAACWGSAFLSSMIILFLASHIFQHIFLELYSKFLGEYSSSLSYLDKISSILWSYLKCCQGERNSFLWNQEFGSKLE